MVIINDAINEFAVPRLLFGRINSSGYGQALSREVFVQFSHAVAHVIGTPPPVYYPGMIMRSPGNYSLGISIIQMAHGVSPEQRFVPIEKAMAADQKRLVLGMPGLVRLAPGEIFDEK